MAVTPNTILYLLKSPLELDNKNQITFASKEAQSTYFLSLPKLEIDRITYQRKDSTIRFPAHIDSLLEYNYCMYKNSNYSNKWFYAYITDMRYENDNMTTITIETDCYQTWMFDIQIKRSFVIREHVNNDTFGLHTVPEGLETGEFVQNGDMHEFSYLSDGFEHTYVPYKYYICVGSNRNLMDTNFPVAYASTGSGALLPGLAYYILNDSDVGDLLERLANAGHIDAIESIFVVPSLWSYLPDPHWVEPFGSSGYKIAYIDTDNVIDFNDISYNIDMKNNIQGYYPRNNKLLTSEFNYLYCTNYTGADTTYKYEHFTGLLNEVPSCMFKLRGSLGPGCSIELIPTQYFETNNVYQAGAYSLPAPKLPLCNWNNDQYTNWLAQTGVNRALSITGSVASIAAGIGLAATGAGVLTSGGLIAGGIGGIINQAAQVHEHSYAPNNTSGSLNNSDINFSNSRCFGFYPMSIKEEYARKIDGIFDAVGYKVNEMKIPNVTGRRNWNYVQTQECAILGTVPQEDLQTIKDMFNSGVTFWHNPATFLDYSQNNGII